MEEHVALNVEDIDGQDYVAMVEDDLRNVRVSGGGRNRDGGLRVVLPVREDVSP
jgi:hypothetical protein